MEKYDYLVWRLWPKRLSPLPSWSYEGSAGADTSGPIALMIFYYFFFSFPYHKRVWSWSRFLAMRTNKQMGKGLPRGPPKRIGLKERGQLWETRNGSNISVVCVFCGSLSFLERVRRGNMGIVRLIFTFPHLSNIFSLVFSPNHRGIKMFQIVGRNNPKREIGHLPQKKQRFLFVMPSHRAVLQCL